MRINSIKLKNIHSLKGTHEVDFSTGPLAQTGLFAIIGPTGSGKSTLLDVITLALFNSTPRSGSLSKSAIEKMGAVITRNTDEAFCEVEYESAGRLFRSRWEISRARTGNLRDYHMSIAMEGDDGKLTFLDLKKGDIPAKNAEIIGLNYDQFIKSILLSQGEFAKFLKSSPKDRSALLEKITGTEIYRAIGKMAFEKQKVEKTSLDKWLEKLGDIELLNEEEITGIKNDIESLLEKIKSGKQQLVLTNQKISIKKQLAEKVIAEQQIATQIVSLQERRNQLNKDDERLSLHKKLLPHKSDIDRVTLLEQNTLELNQELAISEKQSRQLSDEIVTMADDIKLKKGNSQTLQVDYGNLQPVIEEVIRIDQEIKIELSGKAHHEASLAQNLKDANKASQSLLHRNKALERIDQKLHRIDKFIAENPGLETLGDVLPGVINTKAILDEKMNKMDLLLKTDTKLFKEISIVERLDSKFEIVKSQSSEISSQKNTLSKVFDDVLPEQASLLEEIELAGAKGQILTEMLRLSKLAKQHESEIDESNGLLVVQKNQRKTLTSSSEGTSGSIEITEKHIEELQARKEREALEAKYDIARTLLKPEEPCPLCGATHHPFVETYKSSLDETTQNLNAQKLNLSQLKKTFALNTDELHTVRANISQLESNIKRLNGERIITRKDFENLIEKSRLEVAKSDIKTIEELLELNLEKLNKLKSNLSTLSKIDSLDEHLSKLSSWGEKLEEMIALEDNIHKALIPFANSFENHELVHAKIEILQTRLLHFREAGKQKADARENEAEANAAIAELKKQSFVLQQNRKKLEGNVNLIDNKINTYRTNRTSIFGNKDPQKEAKSWNDKIQKLLRLINNLEKQHEIKKEQNNNLEKQNIRIKAELEKLILESNHLQSKLSSKMESLGLQTYMDASNAMLNEEEAQLIQQNLDELKSAIDKAGQSLDDIRKSLLDLNAQDDQEARLETLETIKLNLEQAASVDNQEIGNYTARLNQDIENQNKSAAILSEIKKQEKEYSKWEALNNLIGDAQGSRFSKFAQELTLNQLLGGANTHLKKLSDRYILIHDNSSENDELFVVDTYYGDEKRSVKTLSGGESFLVSLALALGLSDLAGSKTKINSLFIDEGFGSLDQQTLDIALSTLERLQHETNRTIGIISHVEALKERISTQIELSQDASGNSLLKINS